jgi:hypothetical protein
MTCKEEHDFAWGWIGAMILFAVAIMGAYGKIFIPASDH